MRKALLAAVLLSTTTVTALADDQTGEAALGGGIGGAIGGAIGAEIDGRSGAIIGSGVGAAIGAAVTTEESNAPAHHAAHRRGHPHSGYTKGAGQNHGYFCPPGLAKQNRC